MTDEGKNPEAPQGEQPDAAASTVERVDTPGQSVDTSFVDQAIADVTPPPAPAPTSPPMPAPTAPIPEGPPPGINPDLEYMVKQPREFVRAIIQEAINNEVMPGIASSQKIAGSVENFLTSSAEAETHIAASRMKEMTQKVLGADEDYRSNSDLRKRINNSLKEQLTNAKSRAMNGDFTNLKNLSNFGPEHYEAILLATKRLSGIPATSSVPATTYQPSSYTEGVTGAPAGDGGVELTPDDELVIAAYERTRPGYRDKYIKMKQEAIQRGDWEF